MTAMKKPLAETSRERIIARALKATPETDLNAKVSKTMIWLLSRSLHVGEIIPILLQI